MQVLGETDPAGVRRWLWRPFRHDYLAGYDIGANCGQSVPDLLDRCAVVTCFEPSPISYPRLAQRMDGEQRVALQEIAISDHTGATQLADLPGRPHDTGQLVTPGHSGMEWEPASWDQVPLQGVLCRTVDSLTGPPPRSLLIKVDTEGHEVQVLAGARVTLRKDRPDWLVEFHSSRNYETCCAIFRDAGYRVTTVRHPHYRLGSAMWLGHGWIQAIPQT